MLKKNREAPNDMKNSNRSVNAQLANHFPEKSIVVYFSTLPAIIATLAVNSSSYQGRM